MYGPSHRPAVSPALPGEGGLNIEKQSLRDLAVLQVDSEAWFHPTTTTPGPPPRVFHCAAAQGGHMYIFGGHTFQKDVKGLHKYNDLWRLNTVSLSRLRPPNSQLICVPLRILLPLHVSCCTFDCYHHISASFQRSFNGSDVPLFWHGRNLTNISAPCSKRSLA